MPLVISFSGNQKHLYCLDLCLQVKNILKLHGAKREFYISDLVTHVITENVNFPEYEQAKDAKLAIVKVISKVYHLLFVAYFLL